MNALVRSLVCCVLSGVCWAGEAETRDPVLIAHRGLMSHAPENTLPAFITAMQFGFGIELDVHSTADDRLVVIHDATTGRTTDGPNRPVRDVTLAELKQFDAGRWFDPRYQGLRVATLDEVLGAITSHRIGATIIAVNVKSITATGESQLVELIEKHGLLDEAFCFDQSPAISRRLQALNPKLRIGRNYQRHEELNEAAALEGVEVVMVLFVPTAEQVRLLHNSGRQVLHNRAGADESHRTTGPWDKAKAAGVDGILTNFPLSAAGHWRRQSLQASDSRMIRR